MKRKEILSTLLISAGLLGAVSCTSTPADEYDPNATISGGHIYTTAGAYFCTFFLCVIGLSLRLKI
ncbi:MAG: hypothetical protein SNH94_02635 [Rikenellaceae bacterium]